MPRAKNDVEKALAQKGFEKENRHHIYFSFHTSDGLKTRVKTRTSHSKKDIPDNILSQMAKQCSLSKDEFLDLVDCTLSHKDYEQLLYSRDKI